MLFTECPKFLLLITDQLLRVTSSRHFLKRMVSVRSHPLINDFEQVVPSRYYTVNHNLLWTKLASMGFSAKTLSILQYMYGKAISKVTTNNTFSMPFPCCKGVRHGCNLNPLLFNLYISDLESDLTTNGAGNITLANLKAHLLLFADNLV